MEKLYVSSDNLLQITGLKNRLTDAYLNSATITANVNDLTGTLVEGPVTLSYVAASNGNYAGTVPDHAALQVGSRYDVIISVNGGAGLQKQYTIRCEAVNADE